MVHGRESTAKHKVKRGKRLVGRRAQAKRANLRIDREAAEKTLAERFKKSLSPRSHRLLRMVGRLSQDMGSRAYLVGGIVRDIAIGYPNTDLDIAVEMDAERVAREFAHRVGGSFKSLTQFGTCKVETKAFGTLDFATARREIYRRPGALPDTDVSNMIQDLLRRDFSVNAMAICLNPREYGQLLDLCGGLRDLRRGKLRVMHDRSFIDDPTRILRGIRFGARYGFGFEKGTLGLLRQCLETGGFSSISGKRIYTEVKLICMEANALRGLKMLERYGILEITLGARGGRGNLLDVRRRLPRAILNIERAAGAEFAERWICWFASLFAGMGGKRARVLVSYFNLSKEVRAVCLWMAEDCRRVAARLAKLGSAQACQVTVLLKPIPPEGLVHLHAVSSMAAKDLIVKYLAIWRHVAPSLSGGEIASMGVGEGPLVGRILTEILRLKLTGKLKTRDDEMAYVRRHAGRR